MDIVIYYCKYLQIQVVAQITLKNIAFISLI